MKIRAKIGALYSYLGSILDGGKFNVEIYDNHNDTYQAAEQTIREMRELENIHSFMAPPSKFEYLYNTISKTAILLKSISRSSRCGVGKKYNKRNKNKYDIGKRIITTESGYQAILRFFKQDRFQEYELVVSCGSETHESCLFLRKDDDGLSVIYFNPNYSERQDGVQYCHIIRQLLEKFGRKIHRSQAYYSPCFNVMARCSALTWEQMVNHICYGKSPFTNTNLQLEDYTHYITRSAYLNYHGL